MKPFLTINESVVSLYYNGNSVAVPADLFDLSALLEPYRTFTALMQRRLQDVRTTEAGEVDRRAHPLNTRGC